MIVSTAARPGKLQALLEATVAKLKTAKGDPLVRPSCQAPPPPPKAGGLRLHLVSRYDRRGSWAEFPAEEWLLLTKQETARLVPDRRVQVGQTWEVDRATAARLLTHFYPQTEICSFADATAADGPYKHRLERHKLMARVVTLRDGVARVRLEGELRLRHNFYPKRDDTNAAEATVLGYMDLRMEERKVQALRMVTKRAIYAQAAFTVAVRSVP
jgi:hypothetical protein